MKTRSNCFGPKTVLRLFNLFFRLEKQVVNCEHLMACNCKFHSYSTLVCSGFLRVLKKWSQIGVEIKSNQLDSNGPKGRKAKLQIYDCI